MCRKYQNAAKEMGNPTNDELDMIGIKALNLMRNWFAFYLEGV